MKKSAQQKAADNRANQLNPNNPAYYKSRMGNAGNQKSGRQQLLIIHHHEVNSKPNNSSRLCPVCKKRGNIRAVSKHMFGRYDVKCQCCGAVFTVKI